MRASSPAKDGPVVRVSLMEMGFVQTVLDQRIVFPVEQEAAQFGGPGFVLFLRQEFQFAQQVLVAERVQRVIFVIGLPMVVDQPVAAVGKHAQGVHGFAAAFAMHAVEGQLGGAGNVQPVQRAGHAHAAFIHMHRRGLDQAADNGCFDRVQRFIGAFIELGQRPQAQGLAKEVQTGLTQPVEGQQLLVKTDRGPTRGSLGRTARGPGRRQGTRR